MADSMGVYGDHPAPLLDIVELQTSIAQLKQEIHSLRTQINGPSVQPHVSAPAAAAESHELVAIALREMKAKSDEVERLNGENARLRARVADLETQVATNTRHEEMVRRDDGPRVDGYGGTGDAGRDGVNGNGKRDRNGAEEENDEQPQSRKRQVSRPRQQGPAAQAKAATGPKRRRAGNQTQKTASAKQAAPQDASGEVSRPVQLADSAEQAASTENPAEQIDTNAQDQKTEDQPQEESKTGNNDKTTTKPKRKPGRPPRRRPVKRGAKTSADVGTEAKAEAEGGENGGASRTALSLNDEIANSTDVPSSNPAQQEERAGSPVTLARTQTRVQTSNGPQGVTASTEPGDTARGVDNAGGKGGTEPRVDARAQRRDKVAARDRMAKMLMERAEAEAVR